MDLDSLKKFPLAVAVIHGRTRSLVERFERRERFNSNEDQASTMSHVMPEMDKKDQASTLSHVIPEKDKKDQASTMSHLIPEKDKKDQASTTSHMIPEKDKKDQASTMSHVIPEKDKTPTMPVKVLLQESFFRL
jgi:katanin p80 WD40 repeat-containing subunit B1